MSNQTQQKRCFDVINKNGEIIGRYSGKNPRHAGSKAFEQIQFVVDKDNKFIPQKVGIREYTDDNVENITRYFMVTKTELEHPETVDSHEYKYFHGLIQERVWKMQNQPSEDEEMNESKDDQNESESSSDISEEEDQTTQELRIFKAIDKNGEVIGRYTGQNAQHAACKAFNALFRTLLNEDESVSKPQEVHIKEVTHGCDNNETFSYSAIRTKLEHPETFNSKEHKYMNTIKLIQKTELDVQDQESPKPRYFKVINENGEVMGRYTARNEQHAACKAFDTWIKTLCEDDNAMFKPYEVHVKESTRGCDNAETFSYSATITKLKHPEPRYFKVINENGEVIGRYEAVNAKHAACIAFNVWIKTLSDEDESMFKPHKVHVKEVTRGCDNTETFTYSATRTKLELSETFNSTYYKYINTIEFDIVQIPESNESNNHVENETTNESKNDLLEKINMLSVLTKMSGHEPLRYTS